MGCMILNLLPLCLAFYNGNYSLKVKQITYHRVNHIIHFLLASYQTTSLLKLGHLPFRQKMNDTFQKNKNCHNSHKKDKDNNYNNNNSSNNNNDSNNRKQKLAFHTRLEVTAMTAMSHQKIRKDINNNKQCNYHLIRC